MHENYQMPFPHVRAILGSVTTAHFPFPHSVSNPTQMTPPFGSYQLLEEFGPTPFEAVPGFTFNNPELDGWIRMEAFSRMGKSRAWQEADWQMLEIGKTRKLVVTAHRSNPKDTTFVRIQSDGNLRLKNEFGHEPLCVDSSFQTLPLPAISETFTNQKIFALCSDLGHGSLHLVVTPITKSSTANLTINISPSANSEWLCLREWQIRCRDHHYESSSSAIEEHKRRPESPHYQRYLVSLPSNLLWESWS